MQIISGKYIKIIVLLILGIFLQSCWICPEKQSLEFTNSTKTIKILSDDYFIKSIRITEYLPNENYIKMVDSNYVEFIQGGTRGAVEISLKQMGEGYTVNGKLDYQNTDKKYLEYTVNLEKFENKKDGEFDNEVIRFMGGEVTQEKNIFQSNHTCP